MKNISILIPVYNEEKNVKKLYQTIESVISKLENFNFEYLFVDDGSQDSTCDEIKDLINLNPNIKLIEFSRNFGKEIALTAGIQNIDVDAVIILDADLQHPPSLIEEMIKYWEEGYLVVSAKRKYTDKQTLFRKTGSFLFYKIMNKFSDIKIEPGMTDFKLLDKKVLNNLKEFTERNRLFRGLIDWMGFKTHYLEFVAPEREEGESSYDLKNLTKLAINSFTSFSEFPLKLIAIMGILISSIFGLLFLVMLVDEFIFDLNHFSSISFVIVTNSFLIGLLMIGISLLGIYIGNIHQEVTNRPLYIIKDKKV